MLSVGLCELVQHLIILDDISASGSLESMLVIQNTPVTIYHGIPFFFFSLKRCSYLVFPTCISLVTLVGYKEKLEV